MTSIVKFYLDEKGNLQYDLNNKILLDTRRQNSQIMSGCSSLDSELFKEIFSFQSFLRDHISLKTMQLIENNDDVTNK